MSDINSIQWHEENYNNWKASLDKHEERVLKDLEKINSDRKRLDFFKFQIDEAKKEEKKSFNRERFRINKVSNSSIPRNTKDVAYP